MFTKKNKSSSMCFIKFTNVEHNNLLKLTHLFSSKKIQPNQTYLTVQYQFSLVMEFLERCLIQIKLSFFLLFLKIISFRKSFQNCFVVFLGVERRSASSLFSSHLPTRKFYFVFWHFSISVGFLTVYSAVFVNLVSN